MENFDDYTNCYNCTGSHLRIQCGMPMLGCTLCKAYGNGRGMIKNEFRDVEISFSDNGLEYTFKPPSYQCLWCEDKKIDKYILWDNDYQCSISTDSGMHQMPRITAPCKSCCPETHEEAYQTGKDIYFECKKKYYSVREEFKNYFLDDIPAIESRID